MASTFEIHARQHWSFQVVLLGSRRQLEGCRRGSAPGDEPLHCSTWLDPRDIPYDVAHELMAHPCCCLTAS